MIELREVTIDNVEAVMGLEVSPQQRHLVASNERSLAQALVYKDLAWFRAVYVHDVPVGFVMLYLEPGQPPYLWRLMIDRQYQGKGFGAEVVRSISRQLAAQGHEALSVSCVEGEHSPVAFYAGLGFQETGRRNEEGEVVLSLSLG